MDRYKHFLREVLELAGQIYFRRVEAELWAFAEALHNWLYSVIAQPTRNWREGLNGVLAEQEAKGRILVPESRRALIEHLELWEATIDWAAVSRETSRRAIATGSVVQLVTAAISSGPVPTMKEGEEVVGDSGALREAPSVASPKDSEYAGRQASNRITKSAVAEGAESEPTKSRKSGRPALPQLPWLELRVDAVLFPFGNYKTDDFAGDIAAANKIFEPCRIQVQLGRTTILTEAHTRRAGVGLDAEWERFKSEYQGPSATAVDRRKRFYAFIYKMTANSTVLQRFQCMLMRASPLLRKVD